MKKILFSLIIFALLSAPLYALANPGAVDQYGRLFTADSNYQYLSLLNPPNYLSGKIARPAAPFIYYLPILPANKIAQAIKYQSAAELKQNSDLDRQYCQQSQIFADGRYTGDNLNRIKPVCANVFEKIIPEIKKQEDFYKALPSFSIDPVTKVYHVKLAADQPDIFTDRPEIEELRGWIVQGTTDPSMYFVENSGAPVLRKILAEKAKFLFGPEYQTRIIFFDDSLIYSYKIGQPLW